MRGCAATALRKPILLIAHLDVVEAKREDWDFDPFKLQEINGYFRGRGSIDDKAMASIFVANLIEYVKEGFKPDRDIILALTADEELSDSPHDGAHFLLDHHRALIDAEFAINEGGGGALRDGKPFRMSVQHAEKVYQTYMLEVTDPGGHSASGRRDNAIYRLAEALRRLGQFDFPVGLNPVTRAFFERMASAEVPSTADAMQGAAGRPHRRRGTKAAHPPSRVQRGNAHHLRCDAPRGRPCRERAAANRPRHRKLPRSAGSVGCGSRAHAQPRHLDEKVKVIPKGQAVLSPASPINPEIMHAVEVLAGEMWPGVPVIPTMSGGYTDSRWLRNAGIPSYGVSGLFTDPVNSGVHGRNEQVGAKELYDSKEFLYRLVKQLAGPNRATAQ